MPKKKKKTSKQVKWVVPLKYNKPDNIITRFASNMTVQSIENDFKLSFYEQCPPIILGKTQPPPKEIEANCVASVIVTASRMQKFIDALQDHFDQHNASKKPNK